MWPCPLELLPWVELPALFRSSSVGKPVCPPWGHLRQHATAIAAACACSKRLPGLVGLAHRPPNRPRHRCAPAASAFHSSQSRPSGSSQRTYMPCPAPRAPMLQATAVHPSLRGCWAALQAQCALAAAVTGTAVQMADCSRPSMVLLGVSSAVVQATGLAHPAFSPLPTLLGFWGALHHAVSKCWACRCFLLMPGPGEMPLCCNIVRCSGGLLKQPGSSTLLMVAREGATLLRLAPLAGATPVVVSPVKLSVKL